MPHILWPTIEDEQIVESFTPRQKLAIERLLFASISNSYQLVKNEFARVSVKQAYPPTRQELLNDITRTIFKSEVSYTVDAYSWGGQNSPIIRSSTS